MSVDFGTIFQAYGGALQNFANLGLILSLVVGVTWAIIFGIIPGIGAMTGMALFLPFAFYLTPEQALPILIVLPACSCTGGVITTILLNVPGDGTNVATLLDGYPMTKKGQAGRALGAALTSSAAGGVASTLVALLFVPLVMAVMMGVTSAEMVFIVLTGIMFIAVLATGSMVKGIISGAIGLLISFIGFQATSGVARFTYGSIFLYDGLDLIPVCLGLFALPEAISLAATGNTITTKARVTVKREHILEGVKDVFRHWTVWIRSAMIGWMIGVIPGIGSGVSIWIAYGQAKATSSHPEEFGKGAVEGVIAPESANSSTQGGALLTTLALGIPGDPSSSLLLGGLLMVGLIPGPEMLRSHLTLSLTLFLILIAGNILATTACLFASPKLAKMTNIPSRYLSPLILVMVFVAAFTMRQNILDVVVTIGIGTLGIGMDKFGYNRGSLLIGYILGYYFENYFFISLKAFGPFFFLRPICLLLTFVIIGVCLFNPIRNWIIRRRTVTRGVNTI